MSNGTDKKVNGNIGRIVEVKGQRYEVSGVWGQGRAYAELRPLASNDERIQPSVVPTSMINGWLVDEQNAKAS